MLLRRRHKAVIPFADKPNSGHPVLEGVHIKDGHIEAADGYKLLRMAIAEENLKDYPPLSDPIVPLGEREVIIPATALDTALKRIPKRAALPIIESVYVGDADKCAVLTTTDLGTTQTDRVQLIEASYPNTGPLIPAYNPDAPYISLNPEQLEAVVKTAKLLNAHIRFQIADKPDSGTVRVDFSNDNEDVVAVVMSIGLQWPREKKD